MRDKELYHERMKLIVKKFNAGLNDEETKRLEEIQTYLDEKDSEVAPKLRASFGKPMNYIDYLKYLKGETGDG